jgi:hypothetical protein
MSWVQHLAITGVAGGSNTVAPSSPDLAPNNLLRGHVRDIVYGQRPSSLPELRPLIAAAVATAVMPHDTWPALARHHDL